MKKFDCFVIGIAGGSGSGKTTIAERLVSLIGKQNIAHIAHDSYYRDLTHLNIAERALVNFDHPDSLETSLFLKDIQQLKLGYSVDVPLYDFTTHSRKKETQTLEPKPILLVEGILLFSEQELRNEMDVKVFIDCEPDIRFIRRLKRDCEERGRSVSSVTSQYLESVRPMHIQFVEPSKKFADIILPGGNNLAVAVDLLTIRLERFLTDRVDK